MANKNLRRCDTAQSNVIRFFPKDNFPKDKKITNHWNFVQIQKFLITERQIEGFCFDNFEFFFFWKYLKVLFHNFESIKNASPTITIWRYSNSTILNIQISELFTWEKMQFLKFRKSKKTRWKFVLPYRNIFHVLVPNFRDEISEAGSWCYFFWIYLTFFLLIFCTRQISLVDSWRNEGGSLARELTSFAFSLYLCFFFFFRPCGTRERRVPHGARESLHYNIHISNERSYLVNELNAFRFEISVGREGWAEGGMKGGHRSREWERIHWEDAWVLSRRFSPKKLTPSSLYSCAFYYSFSFALPP